MVSAANTPLEEEVPLSPYIHIPPPPVATVVVAQGVHCHNSLLRGIYPLVLHSNLGRGFFDHGTQVLAVLESEVEGMSRHRGLVTQEEEEAGQDNRSIVVDSLSLHVVGVGVGVNMRGDDTGESGNVDGWTMVVVAGDDDSNRRSRGRVEGIGLLQVGAAVVGIVRPCPDHGVRNAFEIADGYEMAVEGIVVGSTRVGSTVFRLLCRRWSQSTCTPHDLGPSYPVCILLRGLLVSQTYIPQIPFVGAGNEICRGRMLVRGE